MKTGLVSVTFRKSSAAEIVAIAQECGLDGIEWGGDVHVPAGEFKQASDVAALTRAAGLEVASYGSYYRATEDQDFTEAIETAGFLGAPNIRVWAGEQGSIQTDVCTRVKVVDKLRQVCERADAFGMTASAEYHPNTLTDTLESTLQLVGEVGHPNFKLYWQPNPARPHEERLAELRAVAPHLSNLHVFQWTSQERHPLAEGEPEWREYLGTASGDRYALLEFVKNDCLDAFRRDAASLRNWIHSTP